jgi:hypothetical protein
MLAWRRRSMMPLSDGRMMNCCRCYRRSIADRTQPSDLGRATCSRNSAAGCLAMSTAMRRASLVIRRCPVPVQLEQKRFCEDLRGEHAIFDHSPCYAAIRCSDNDYTVAHDIVARYAFAIEILNTDFFTHCGDPFWGRFTNSLLR